MAAAVSSTPARTWLVAVAVAAAICVGAVPASGQLATFETTGVRLVYLRGGDAYLIPHATRTFLNSLAFQKKLFGFTPSEDITVLILDLEDAGNASATVVPRNALTVQTAPLNFAFETIAGNDRFNIIMNHELVHVAAMDQAARGDRVFRRLFGGKVAPVGDQPESIVYFYLTTPRVAAPRWYHEGVATFVDTWMAGGLGRAQGGYDEMVFRAMVKDGAPFYDPLGLVSEGTKIDFQLQVNSYLYGTRFTTWLARTYSPEHVVRWIQRTDGSRAYFAHQFAAVFGTSLEDAWRRWVADERTFQEANLAAVRQYPTTPYSDLTSRALGSVSRAHYDAATRTLYAGLNYPGVVAHVGAIRDGAGTIERLVDIKGPTVYDVTSLARDPATGTLYYTTDNRTYRDLMQLDPATRRTTMLQKDARIGDLAFSAADRVLWGIRQLSGLCTLVRMEPPYRSWTQVHTFPYGTVVYDLDVSPDGQRLVASFGEIDGKQDVRVLDVAALTQDDATPVGRFDFGTSVPNNFVFSPSGRYLFGSSYYTGISNLFRYELATGAVEAVTNAETGFFRPIPLSDEELIAFRYSGAGFVPTRLRAVPLTDVSAITFLGERLAAERPSITTWNVGSPAAVPLESLPTREGVYHLAGGLRRESIFPIVQGYKDSPAVGLRASFSDRLQLNRLFVSASYSPDTALASEERAHLAAGYDRYDWRVRAAYNNADFYDLFGPTKVGRKGYHALVGHRNLLLYDEPRRLDLDVSARIDAEIDRLPDYQNVPVAVDRLYGAEATLRYSDIRNSLGYVDDETGQRWTTTVESQVVDGLAIPRIYGTYDRGLATPLPHSSVWIRGAAGLSPRDEGGPFANFYFGGFGNNYVDHGDEKRYRQFYALPGRALNSVAGRNFVKGTLEWNLPPWRFTRIGTPGAYATWLRPAVFVSGLATDLDDDDGARREVGSAGAQLDVRLMLLSELEMTLSVGGAVAFERHQTPRRELMVSLKVLR